MRLISVKIEPSEGSVRSFDLCDFQLRELPLRITDSQEFSVRGHDRRFHGRIGCFSAVIHVDLISCQCLCPFFSLFEKSHNASFLPGAPEPNGPRGELRLFLSCYDTPFPR